MTPDPDARRTVVVPGVGVLVVDAATGACVDAAPGADPAAIDGLLRGSGQALAWQLRRVLPLHLAAVTVGGRSAVGLVGPPGIGKSSLAAALSGRGPHLVTDDIAAVHWSRDGTPLLVPNPPQVRLWGDTARQLGWPTDDRHRIGGRGDKFAYDLPDRFVARPVPLTAVYVLNPPGASEVGFAPLHGSQRFDVFHRGATYNADLLDTPEARRWHFGEALRLAQRVPAWHLTRPVGVPLMELAAALERHATKRSPARKGRR